MKSGVSTETDQIDHAPASELFEKHARRVRKETDRLFALLFSIQLIAAISAAFLVSPHTSMGLDGGFIPNFWTAVFVAVLVTITPLCLVVFNPGAKINGFIVGVGQILMSVLLIHLTGGRLETHFYVIGSLAFISFYRNWKVLIPAAFIVAVDHVVRGWFYPMSIYGIPSSGEWRWLEHTGWVIFTVLFLIASCRRSVREMWDIADRTADLNASEARHRAVVEQTDEAIFLVDPSSLEVKEYNRGFAKLLGYNNITEGNAIFSSDFSLLKNVQIKQLARDHIKRGIQQTKETVYRRTDGTLIPVEIRVTPINFGNQRALSISARDISERKCVEAELRAAHDELEARVEARTNDLVTANQSLKTEVNERRRIETDPVNAKEFYSKVINQVPVAMFVRNEEGKYILANEALAEMYNTSVKAILGKTASDFVTGKHEQEQITAADKDILETLIGTEIPEQEFVDSKGERKWLQIIKRPLITENGKSKNILGIFIDLTGRKTIESQLRHAQKMESIGQLAAGIAHEINTPTQYVGDNIRFIDDAFADINGVLDKYHELAKSVTSGNEVKPQISEVENEIKKVDLKYLTDEIPSALSQSLEGVSRISKIVESMRDFAHPGTNEKKFSDINKAIQSTITVAQNQWKYVAEIETDYDTELPLVPCFIAEFNQVILNMVVNASHAIADVVGDGSGGKGTIKISTSYVDDQWAKIAISDSGKGIPKEVGRRIFEPFYTTKEVGKGTGQGLAISHRVIVEKHGGDLAFESTPGEGTTFTIRLPLGEINARA